MKIKEREVDIMSRATRKQETINSNIQKNTSKINSVENRVTKLEKQYDEHVVTHIVDDLGRQRFRGSDKPMYTYSEIADKYGTSATTVGRIANENGLSRRNKNDA